MSIRSNFPNIRPTLNLDFANTRRLDSRVSFGRSGSAGTYVNASGIIQTTAANVPRFDHNPATGDSLGLLIEESRANVFTYSDRLDDATWTKTNVVLVPNSLSSPDGYYTGGLLVSQGSGAATVSRVYYRNTPAFSVYLKAGTSTSANVKILSDVAGRNVSYNVNLSTGTITAGSGNTGNLTGWAEYTSISNAGNGWYRVFIGFNSTSNPTSVYSISPALDGNALGANESIYVWGAQLESGSFPTTYIPTAATFTGRTGSATFYDVNGVIQTAGDGVARSAAYFPTYPPDGLRVIMQPAGLLLEPASTNLLNGSQTFATSGGTQNDWVDTNITRDGTLRASPDGTSNALRVTASAANATIISSAAVGSSAQRTFSIFLRRVSGTGAIQYTLDNGSTWTTRAITTGWVRYSFPATTADHQVGIRIVNSGDVIELWGAQLEASPYATSYIPTTTSTVTRSADTSTSSTATRSAESVSISGTNFSSWFNQNEYTLYTEISAPGGILWRFQNSTRWYAYVSSTGFYSEQYDFQSGGTGATAANGNPSLDRYKTIATVDNIARIHRVCFNGGTVAGGYDTQFNHAQVTIGFIADFPAYMNSRLARLTYYPKRLSDIQLQNLTR